MAEQKFLDVPPVAQKDKKSFELIRVWIAEQGQHVSLRSGVWEDPAYWGVMLADLAKHIVKAHTLEDKDLDGEDFLERLRQGFETEMDSETDEATGRDCELGRRRGFRRRTPSAKEGWGLVAGGAGAGRRASG